MAGFDPQLDQRLTALRKQAIAAAASLSGTQKPKAEQLTDDQPAPAHADNEAVTQLFEPEEAVRSYLQMLQGSDADNTVAQGMAAKLQISMMSSMEREYKSRRHSRIRRYAHEAARRRRHGDPRGPVQSYLRRPIQNLLSRSEEV